MVQLSENVRKPNVRFIFIVQTERLKSELFGNRTKSKNAEIRTFGFQTLTVDCFYTHPSIHPPDFFFAQIIITLSAYLIYLIANVQLFPPFLIILINSSIQSHNFFLSSSLPLNYPSMLGASHILYVSSLGLGPGCTSLAATITCYGVQCFMTSHIAGLDLQRSSRVGQ